MPPDPVIQLDADLRKSGFLPTIVNGQVLLMSPDGSPLPHGATIDAVLGKRLHRHRRELRLRIGGAA